MNIQGFTVELHRPIARTNHIVLLRVGKDDEVTGCRALSRSRAMEGVTALEDLQIPLAEFDLLHAAVIAQQQLLYVLIALVILVPNVGDVLKYAPLLTVLNQECHGELVGVVVP